MRGPGEQGAVFELSGLLPFSATGTDSQTPDTILSDIQMPGMDGVAFRETLREKRPELLAQFANCPASMGDASVPVYLARHQIRVLPKPVTPADVRAFLAGERSDVRRDLTGRRNTT